jgi:hypothetical protein
MAHGVSLLRPLRSEEVVCPAGTLSGDADVHCGIEEHLIKGPENPETVGGFCCDNYTACTTWLAAKKVEEMGGDLRKILREETSVASQLRTAKALREARLRRQQALLTEDSPEGRKFREQVARVMAAAERRAA